jgi:hypothetical protein
MKYSLYSFGVALTWSEQDLVPVGCGAVPFFSRELITTPAGHPVLFKVYP